MTGDDLAERGDDAASWDNEAMIVIHDAKECVQECVERRIRLFVKSICADMQMIVQTAFCRAPSCAVFFCLEASKQRWDDRDW